MKGSRRGETDGRLREQAEFRYQLRRFLSFSESAAERCGVPAQQYQLLQVVGAAPAAERASIGYVAERMLLRHHSAVELVDRAERAELVRRVADPEDHRRSLVELTVRGAGVLRQLLTEHLDELQRQGPELVRALARLADVKDALKGEGERR
jgi:DNA-binding MarR family transcriptional regulator